jgi:hypothetical protein
VLLQVQCDPTAGSLQAAVVIVPVNKMAPVVAFDKVNDPEFVENGSAVPVRHFGKAFGLKVVPDAAGIETCAVTVFGAVPHRTNSLPPLLDVWI